MKVNQWTLGLAAAGVISFGAVAQAEERPANQVLTAVSSTALSGYVSTSAHWVPGKAAPAGGYSYSAAKADGFNLDVVSLRVSKPLDEGEWSTGYAVELWLGADAGGLATTLAGTTTALKNAYVALNAPVGNGLVIRMGVIDTVIGYESANAGENPNYTRSYGNSVEPTTHTGVTASYKFCENMSAVVGIANASGGAATGINARSSGVNFQSRKAYMGAVSLTAPESLGFLKGATLTAGVVDGRTTVSAADNTSIYAGITIPTPWETLRLGASYDHLNIDAAGAAGVDSDAYALYVGWTASEKLKINGRLEYADGPAFYSAAAEVFASTVTLDYALWANVISRAEYRWDHQSGGVAKAFGAGTRRNSHLVAVNLIYKF